MARRTIINDTKRSRLEQGKSVKLRDSVFARKKGRVLVVNIESEKRGLFPSELRERSDWAFERKEQLAREAGADYTEVNVYG